MRRRGWAGWGILLGVLLLVGLPLWAVGQGYLHAPDGSATRPGRSYTLDTRLGSYRIGRDNEGFVADGQLRWHYGAGAPSGAVVLHVLSGMEARFGGPLYTQAALGVGTDSPTTALHVLGTGAITGALRLASLGLNVDAPTSTLHVVGSLAVTGTVAFQTGLTATSISFSTDNAFNLGTSATAGRMRDLFVARNAHVAGFLHIQAAPAWGAHVVVVASNGVGGVANAETLAGLHPVYLVECLDGDGCTITVAENASVGTLVRIVNISTSGAAAHNLTLSDAAPLHLAGALTLTADDAVTLLYVINRSGDGNWIELGRSAN